ncbi:MAG: hypothetical protein FWE82_02535 [Defluviitaleaceae bacterium]|nr:hypothetical protein [Defluviitaleaceae bacterium]
MTDDFFSAKMFPLYPWARDWSRYYVYQWHLTDHGEFNSEAGGGINKMGYCFGPPDVKKTLAQIKAIDNVTRGMPKVIILCGWQRYVYGQKHPLEYKIATWDCMFPSFVSTSEEFCMQGLADPLGCDSATDPNAAIRWLMEEAKRHNTLVTFHVNFQSCGKDSPLYQTYMDSGVLIKRDGKVWSWYSHVDGGLVNLREEFDRGLFQKRIGQLFDTFPAIKETKLLHVDYNTAETGDGYSAEDNVAAMRRDIIYIREQYGVDVSCELGATARPCFDYGFQCLSLSLRDDMGEQPHNPMEVPAYIYHAVQTEESGKAAGSLRYSNRTLLFGSSMQGEFGTNFTGSTGLCNWEWYRRTDFPEQGYEDHIQIDFNNSSFKSNNLFRDFAYSTLSRHYLNRLARIESDCSSYAFFSDGVVSRIDDGKIIIEKNGSPLRVGGDIFIPAMWKRSREIIAFSDEGYERKKWTLPENWNDVEAADIYDNFLEGLSIKKRNVPIENGELELSLSAFEGVVVVPYGQDPNINEKPAALSGSAFFTGLTMNTGNKTADKDALGFYVPLKEKKFPSDIFFDVIGGTEAENICGGEKIYYRAAAPHQIVEIKTESEIIVEINCYWPFGNKAEMIAEAVDTFSGEGLGAYAVLRGKDVINGVCAAFKIKGHAYIRVTQLHGEHYGSSNPRVKAEHTASPTVLTGVFINKKY